MAHRSRAHRAPVAKPRRTTRQKFRKLVGRDPGQVGRISVPVNPQQPLGYEAVPHYWHPDRPSVVLCEREFPDFHAKLIAVHPDLRLTRPPSQAPVPKEYRCWTLWVRKPSIKHHLSPGWMLLLPWAYYGRELPLDERLFAAIAHFDRRHLGENAVQYFDRLIAERDRDREKRKVKDRADVVAEARDYMQSTKIKNIGRGNKFALHHDGTILPSRGERNWTRENERHMLPKRVLQDRERRRS